MKEEYWQIVRQLPGIARNDAGEVLASPEALTVINMPSLQQTWIFQEQGNAESAQEGPEYCRDYVGSDFSRPAP